MTILPILFVPVLRKHDGNFTFKVSFNRDNQVFNNVKLIIQYPKCTLVKVQADNRIYRNEKRRLFWMHTSVNNDDLFY